VATMAQKKAFVPKSEGMKYYRLSGSMTSLISVTQVRLDSDEANVELKISATWAWSLIHN
jgi:hypothetical protein